jgi:hemerythrin-like metal-binding protein
MQNDDLLEWGPKLLTGIEAIDEQHEMLVDMLNEANLRMRALVERSVVEDIVRDLMSYALYHFETEEELMLERAYAQESPDDAATHSREHREFSQTVASVQQDLVAGKPITREVLLGFLNNWLVNHILNTDMRLAAFLKN